MSYYKTGGGITALVSVTLLLLIHYPHIASADLGFDPKAIASNYIRDHPIGRNPTLEQAIDWERGILDLGMTVGKSAREHFFQIMPALQDKLLAKVRHIGIHHRLDDVLHEVVPQVTGIWDTVTSTSTVVRGEFARLHRQGAEQIARAAKSASVALRLGKIMTSLPNDIDAAQAQNEKRWKQTLAHFDKIVHELEATVRKDHLPGQVLSHGATVLWQLLVDQLLDALQEFSSEALVVHEAVDKKVKALLRSLEAVGWWSWLWLW